MLQQLLLAALLVSSTGNGAEHSAARAGVQVGGQRLTAGAEVAARTILKASALGDVAAVQSALTQHDVVEVTDHAGRTPLMLAASAGHSDIVSLLLKAGASTADADKSGLSALHWATLRGRNAVVEMLLASGSDINATNHDNATALHFAVGTQNHALVQLFCHRGANLEITSRENQVTPLRLAIKQQDLQSMKILRRAGAAPADPDRAETRAPAADT